MRCTNCQTKLKPVVAVDIDGTMGDYHTHFLNFACMYLGVENDHVPPYNGDMGFKVWFCKVFATDETTWNQIKLAYRQGAQKRSMPMYRNAADLVAAARREGAEVWLTTTRPHLRLDGVDPDTRFWLALNGIEYDGLLYDEDKYRVLAERVDPGRVVAVLDDLGDQVMAAAAAFGKHVPIMRITHYNCKAKARQHYHTALDLFEAQDKVLQRVRSWNDAH